MLLVLYLKKLFFDVEVPFVIKSFFAKIMEHQNIRTGTKIHSAISFVLCLYIFIKNFVFGYIFAFLI